MDKKYVIKEVIEFTNKIKNVLNIKQVILYGSYSKGTQQQDSDIDVAVIVKDIKEDFLDTISYLYKIRREIDEKIEPVLIEYTTNDKTGFLTEILNTGEIIYTDADV